MNMGKSVPISAPAYRTPEGYVVKHYLEHCISAVRSKINEVGSFNLLSIKKSCIKNVTVIKRRYGSTNLCVKFSV